MSVDLEITCKRARRELRDVGDRGASLHEVSILVLCLNLAHVRAALEQLREAGLVSCTDGRWRIA